MYNSKSYRAERKALQYLYGDAEEDALVLDLAQSKENEETYSKDLDAFKKLFNSGDRDLQMAAWNALTWMNDFAKEDFTDEEAAFLAKFRDAVANRLNTLYKNPNRSIPTARLILRPADKVEELQLYHDHLQKDGDFSLYTGLNLTKNNLNKFTLDRPYCFAIYEKKSGKMIGMVGLHSYKEKKCMTSMEWYIFKPYRKRGYAKEAVWALTKQAFSGKLAEMRETSWQNIFRRHYAKIDLIRVHIREANAPSQALAKACGFVYQYTDKRYFEIEGKGCEDAKVYELTPDGSKP